MVVNDFKNKFKGAIDVLKTFNENGFEAYFVGGCVRDYILKDEFSDIDITTNALPEQVKKIFKKTIDTGIKHGTVTILVGGESYEVTTFRTEDEYTNHRSPEKVEFVSNLREDLDRRDFTINAMAIDFNGILYDYHNGKDDLNTKVIKTVNNPNERFFEDALRMLRAFRFASKLGFEIEYETLNAIKSNAELIKFVSIERIVNEFRKLLLGKGNLRSMQLMLESDLNQHIPFLNEINIVQDLSKYSFCQSLYILSKINNISLDKLKELKLSNKEIKLVNKYEKINEDFINNVPLEWILYQHGLEDVLFINEFFEYVDSMCIKETILLITTFNDVNTIRNPPGPWIKEITSKIEMEILAKRLNNNKSDILDFLSKLRDNK